MKYLLCVTLAVIIAGFIPTAFCGVITLTSKGIQYMNDDQFAALQDPSAPGAHQQPGAWQDEPEVYSDESEAYPEYDDAPSAEDDDEEEDDDDELQDESEEDDDENEDESEEQYDEPAEEDETVTLEPKSKRKAKYTVKHKTPKVYKEKSKSQKKKKIQKLKEESDEKVDDDADDEPREPPPMPAILKHEMMLSKYGGGASGGGPMPLTPVNPFSRMTSYLGSLLGRAGTFGSDPIYLNRNAKSLDGTEEKTLTREKRQIRLKDYQPHPFYHVRNNIRTMVRRQPSPKISPEPIDDFSTNSISKKGSKPFKLTMEPYAVPQTYQNPPINPAQGVRGPSPGSLANPSSGSLGNSGLGQGLPSTPNNGGGQQKQSTGRNKNKKTSNNQNYNKNSSEESDEEDSDEDEYSNEQELGFLHREAPDFDISDEDFEDDEDYNSAEEDDYDDEEDEDEFDYDDENSTIEEFNQYKYLYKFL